MLKAIQILVRTIVLAVSVANLAACGQRGPLYLPSPPVTSDRPAPAKAAASSNGQPAPTIPSAPASNSRP